MKYPYSYPFAHLDELGPKRTTLNSLENKSLAKRSQHLLWRMNGNATESEKISAIKSDQIFDSVHVHSCYQASVMDLNPWNLSCNNDSAPLMMCCFTLSGKGEFGFDQSCTFIGLRDRESEPIPISWTGADIPEF
jgi:hypothetical protein